jgi:hypothetical protein
MNYKKHLAIVTFLLTGLALWLFLYKVLVLNLPLLPFGTSTVWTVEARVGFLADGRPAKVSFTIPPNQPGFARINEDFVSRNYGSSVARDGDNRIATLSIRRATDIQTLYYRTQLYVDPEHIGATLSTRANTNRPNYEGAKLTAAETIISNVRETSADSLTFAIEIIKSLLDTDNGNSAVLLDRNFSTENIAKTAVDLLIGPNKEFGPNITARLVYGFQLTDDVRSRRDIPLSIYLAVRDSSNDKWNYINPETATRGLPDDFLIWQYGDQALINIEGGSNANIAFSFTQRMQETLDIAQEAAIQSKSPLMTYSLFNLPLPTQIVYQILIMIPLGALIILLLRSFIGLQTFGTFMPVLIALSFRETHLLAGIVMFTAIVCLGLSVRFYLEKLKLLMIPRLSAVLSSVVLIMILISIFSYHLGLQYGLSIALFPMVIITMTIERMSIVWEERSAWEAIQQAIGSLIAAILAYIVMSNNYAEHMLFVFPELIFILVSIMLWLGHYHGYRLTELYRFKDLIKDK